MEKKHLDTLKEISIYVGWSSGKILVTHKEDYFPMKKIRGRWTSHVDLINEWFKHQCQSS